MSEDYVTIEVDGQTIETRKGAMLIEATDAAGIYIPRFCYHKKLSVVANCRMCLVEVERAPKPLPACATPVMDGMKVFTRSKLAVEAQRATMEFLLINHPLDCPICDQGGECELQDLSLGYGGDISRYTDRKRVVRDKDIGPLVQTDMTRCIHCTRCVRFGAEIAGLRELGATGRGEHMRIGTYVEHAMSSELSGNIIDLCPVGALTSKPYRYSARAWELQQRDSVAPHDCVGSNVHVHIKGRRVKRVVPQDNELINETWLADRDRFSYEGLNSDKRLLVPRIKTDGAWADAEWTTALDLIAGKLRGIAQSKGAERIGALASPSSTTEEFYLLQRVLRGLGSHNIDHRVRQSDFSDQAIQPAFPGLGMGFDGLEGADAVLLIGSHLRHDQPLLNQRLRKAVSNGAKVTVVGTVGYDFNFALHDHIVVRPSEMTRTLAGIAGALIGQVEADIDEGTRKTLETAGTDQRQRDIARCLLEGERTVVLLGNAAQRHASRSTLRALAGLIADWSGGRLGHLTEGANAAGAWLAGAVPHRGPGGRELDRIGLDARAMLDEPLSAYLLLGIEPDLDCRDGAKAKNTLQTAEFVVSLSAFQHPALDELADVLLPIGLFAENEGSYVNVAGTWQSFQAAVPPPAEARAAWKILRLLGERLDLPGFDAVECSEVTNEAKALFGEIDGLDTGPRVLGEIALGQPVDGIEPIVEIPMYAVDPLVRRATALSQMPPSGDDHIYLSPETLVQLKLGEDMKVAVSVNGARATLITAADPRLPGDSCLYFGARPATASIEAGGVVTIERID